MLQERCRGVACIALLAAVLWGLAGDVGARGSAATERVALEALYYATGGAGWTNNASWLSDTAPVHEWHGVVTDASGRVTELRLGNNGLTGPLPAALGNLRSLRDLGLSNNRLTGPIPITFSTLASIEELDLGGNALSGSVPAVLEKLHSLRRLYLWSNRLLTGPLPRGLTHLPLDVLDMSETDACVPEDPGFQNWVDSIADFMGRFCDEAEVPFTDPKPAPGSGPVREVHLTELRVYVDSLRLRCELELFPWTDAVIVRSVTPVRAVHVNELRHGLTEAFEACDATPPSWSDPAPARGAPIRAAHFAELRDAVVAGPRSSAGSFDLSTVEWLHHDVSDWPETSSITEIAIHDVPRGRICIEHTKRRDWPGVSFVFGGERVELAGNPWVFAQVDGQWYAATYEWLRPGQRCKLNTSMPPSLELGDHIKKPPLSRWVPQSGETVGFMVSTPARTGPRGPLRERSNIEFAIWP